MESITQYSKEILPWNPEVFLLMNECKAKRQNTREPLGAHTLGPLNVPIQSEAIIELSELRFDLETSQTASDWISMSKGINMCTQRFSCLASPLCLTLVRERENVWIPG